MYHHVPSVLHLYTPFFPFSESVHPLYSLSLPLCSNPWPELFLLFVTPLLLLHAWLLAGPGQEQSAAGAQALAASLPSCLGIDEKQRQICLWFKVHPGNYSD